MPLEKIRKAGGGLASNQRLWIAFLHINCSQIAAVIPAKLLDKKVISCVKYRKNKLIC